MKSIFRILATVVLAQILICTRADARGEIPPPPPFMGGGAGDWLGSGPVFGFEEPSLGSPWNGGYGAGSGSNGGWGGAWWEGNGPLGGGGWGGWGGWGSGLGPGSGGWPIDTDTTKKGHIWPDDVAHGFTSCDRVRWTGPSYNGCGCLILYYNGETPSGTVVDGKCVVDEEERDPQGSCPYVGVACKAMVQ